MNDLPPSSAFPNGEAGNLSSVTLYPRSDQNMNNISAEDIKAEAAKLLQVFEPVKHNEILKLILDQIEIIDFREKAGFTVETQKLAKKHFLVCTIEHVLTLALLNNWGICKHHAFVYLYNGAYWNVFDNDELQSFLGKAAEKMGIDKFDARLYSFQAQLYKQFIAAGNLPKPEEPLNAVLINLRNGTFEIRPDKQQLRPPDRNDFITYQLPFEYNPKAKAPIFTEFLNKVQPDLERQNILAEYLAYLFVKRSTLNLEKTLLLYGTGANGKSVFFDVVNALLGGNENVSYYSLQSLTNETGYQRAMLANKLLNYASEINGKLENAIFKQLASGEPIEARLPYHDPFTLTDYAKLIFNCNELPKDAEQTNAYFRRFLIVPFDVTIPESEQDKQLAQKIIKAELSGVFNWVLDGLKRLLEQKNFTSSDAVTRQLDNFRLQSDSVRMFLVDEGFEKSTEEYQEFKVLFSFYRSYCNESGYYFCSKRTFAERLRNAGFVLERKNYGVIVFVKKHVFHNSLGSPGSPGSFIG
jgi:putative DNA primase/helicase